MGRGLEGEEKKEVDRKKEKGKRFVFQHFTFPSPGCEGSGQKAMGVGGIVSRKSGWRKDESRVMSASARPATEPGARKLEPNDRAPYR